MTHRWYGYSDVNLVFRGIFTLYCGLRRPATGKDDFRRRFEPNLPVSIFRWKRPNIGYGNTILEEGTGSVKRMLGGNGGQIHDKFVQREEEVVEWLREMVLWANIGEKSVDLRMECVGMERSDCGQERNEPEA